MKQPSLPADGTRSTSAAVDALAALARSDSGRIIALIARRFGDLDLADEAVADALATAAEKWPVDGVPERPAAWLMTVARRNAIDRLRRVGSAHRRIQSAAPDLLEAREEPDAGGDSMIVDDSEIDDAQLRLLLLCCHPSLDRDTQVALTLRLVGGLSTAEVAAALLVTEPTMAQRIVRAKHKIRAAAIPMSLPADLADRLGAVLTVVYLVFNEGYLSHSEGPTLRAELTSEAIRIASVVVTLAPDEAEAHGLLALLAYLESRSTTRIDGAGDLVLLEDQDRSKWNAELIALGNAALGRAMALMAPGRFQVEATIAGLHANASTADATDWPLIADLYGQLAAMTESPVVELNRAVAMSMVDGWATGLGHLETLSDLGDYHLYWSTRAELLARSDRLDEAAQSFRRARALAPSDAERRHLDRRLTVVDPS